MNFKDQIAQDIHGIFLNTEEFAEKRTVQYDGESYDIPVVLSSMEEKARQQPANDHAQGLFQDIAVLHCAAQDLGDFLPKKGSRIAINSYEGSEFFRDYYVLSISKDMGMLRIELEAVSESGAVSR